MIYSGEFLVSLGAFIGTLSQLRDGNYWAAGSAFMCMITAGMAFAWHWEALHK